MEYRSCPMPDHSRPTPPTSRSPVLRRLRRPLRASVTRSSSVPRSPASSPPTASWDVTARQPDSGTETRRYRAVVVANGHHWDPRWPEPAFPGADTFTGDQIHSHYYKPPTCSPASGCSCSASATRRRHRGGDLAVAERTFMAMRRGAYVFPKFMFGKPSDDLISPFDRGCLAGAAGVMAALLRLTSARSPTTGCRSRTTSCSTPTRPSPRTCWPGSATATSPSSRTSPASRGPRWTSSTAAARSSTSSSTAPATGSASRSWTRP